MELQIFKNEQFGEVRTIEIKGEPFFNLNDCCQILDLSNPRKTLERLNPKGVTSSDILTTEESNKLTSSTKRISINLFFNLANQKQRNLLIGSLAKFCLLFVSMALI